jgi:hypothetical protein
VRRVPVIGKKFGEMLRGMGREATEDVGEIRGRIDVVVATSGS